MADQLDKNGYNRSDFNRNSDAGQMDNNESMEQDGDEGSKLNEKAGEYMRDLLGEKLKLNQQKFPVSCKLIDQEVVRVQSSGRGPNRDSKYVDVFARKPVKVTVKVLVPINEHPKFNFVGKLLGPKGNTMKQMQDETMCKMAVLGRGSMKDRRKEDELRNSLDPKYAHLQDELHVEISALAPPAEAHARIAYALAEVKKYLIPDPGHMDMMSRPPMREMMERDSMGPPAVPRPPPKTVLYSDCTVTKRSMSFQGPVFDQGAPPRPPLGRGPPRMPPAPPLGHSHPHRPMPGKAKVVSILDRARTAMESSYSGYDDAYALGPEPPQVSRQVRGPPRAPEPEFYYDRADRYYEDEPYYKDEPAPREFKASARDVGTRRAPPAQQQRQHFARHSPYARPPK